MIFLVACLELLHLVHTINIDSISVENDTFIDENNITDVRLLEKLETFTYLNGLRRQGTGHKEILRYPPEPSAPRERLLNIKILDMMKQAIYETQYNMKALEPITEKYKNDPATRMAYIFARLKQLIIDMRRIYTVAMKWEAKSKTLHQIFWYTHCVRKYVDILYIVEHLLVEHLKNIKKIGENNE